MPFTSTEFFDVFSRYNAAVWPAQLALVMLGAAAVLFARLSTPRASIAASMVLGALWIWMGVAYHLAFFSAINPLAPVFAAAFLAEGLMILVAGAWRRRIELQVHGDAISVVAIAIIVYALLGYPVLGYFLGHRYPAAPTFGVPCPTTIFSFGLFLLARPRVPRMLLIIPALWAVVATSAAVSLGMVEDFGLPVAALIAIGVSLPRRHGRASDGVSAMRTAPRGTA